MKNSFLFIFILSLLVISFGCKSKQQTVALSSAHQQAGVVNTPEVLETEDVYVAPPYGEPEEVRDEKFTLDTDERNTGVINMRYHVVVGSFKNRDNAKSLQNTLNNEGNNAVIVVNEQGMYRVLLASYNEYGEARGRINRVNNRFPDAWVLVQKQ